MDSVLSDRVDWECPGESADSGSGSDFTRSRWANDILDAEDKFQQAMITVLTGSAFLAPIVAAFDAAFDSESSCQQLPQSAALRVLMTRDLIPARFKEMTSSVKSEVERRFAGVIADMRPVSGARPTGSASYGGWINLYLGPYIKTCMIKNMVKFFIRRPLVVPESFNQTIFEDRERQNSLILEKQRVLQSVRHVVSNLSTMIESNLQTLSDDTTHLSNSLAVQGHMHAASSLTSSGSSADSVSQAGSALGLEDHASNQTDISPPSFTSGTSDPDSFVQV